MLRPLLGFHKMELEEHCRQHELQYVRDPTNAELSYHRNRIRHVLQQVPTTPPFDTESQVAAAPSTGHGEEAGSDEVPGSGSAGGSVVADILLLQRRCEQAAEWQQAQGDRLLFRAVLHTSCDELPRQEPGHADKQAQPRSRTGAEQQRQQSAAAAKWEYARQQPWFIDWPRRLAQVSHVALVCAFLFSRRLPPCSFHPPLPLQAAEVLQPLPYVLLCTRSLARAQELVALGAVSRVLHAVSGGSVVPAHGS